MASPPALPRSSPSSVSAPEPSQPAGSVGRGCPRRRRRGQPGMPARSIGAGCAGERQRCRCRRLARRGRARRGANRGRGDRRGAAGRPSLGRHRQRGRQLDPEPAGSGRADVEAAHRLQRRLGTEVTALAVENFEGELAGASETIRVPFEPAPRSPSRSIRRCCRRTAPDSTRWCCATCPRVPPSRPGPTSRRSTAGSSCRDSCPG